MLSWPMSSWRVIWSITATQPLDRLLIVVYLLMLELAWVAISGPSPIKRLPANKKQARATIAPIEFGSLFPLIWSLLTNSTIGRPAKLKPTETNR